MELLLDVLPVPFAERRLLLAFPNRQTLPRAWDKASPPATEWLDLSLSPATLQLSENQIAGFCCMTINGELHEPGRIIYLFVHSSEHAKPNSVCVLGLYVRAKGHGLVTGVKSPGIVEWVILLCR